MTTGTYAAFTGTTSNSANQFSAGTVSLSDNDNNAAMMSFTNQRPGVTSSSCINVTYTGSLSTSAMKLYAAPSGALASYVNVKVTRGTDSSPTFAGCTNFRADTTNYSGLGPGVLWSGTLSAFPAAFASGISGPVAGWTTGSSASYMFTVDIADINAAQGLAASASFTWEARS